MEAIVVVKEENSVEKGATSESFRAAQTRAFSQLSPDLGKLNVGIRALEQWYASDFKRRVMEVKELLQEETVRQVSAQFAAEFDSRLEYVRIKYQERLSAQAAESEKER